jgi:ferredoxin
MLYYSPFVRVNRFREKENGMKAVVDESACVGCGLCADTCPDVFEMNSGVAKVIVEVIPENAVDSCKEAAQACPVEAITVSN